MSLDLPAITSKSKGDRNLFLLIPICKRLVVCADVTTYHARRPIVAASKPSRFDWRRDQSDNDFPPVRPTVANVGQFLSLVHVTLCGL